MHKKRNARLLPPPVSTTTHASADAFSGGPGCRDSGSENTVPASRVAPRPSARVRHHTARFRTLLRARRVRPRAEPTSRILWPADKRERLQKLEPWGHARKGATRVFQVTEPLNELNKPSRASESKVECKESLLPSVDGRNSWAIHVGMREISMPCTESSVRARAFLHCATNGTSGAATHRGRGVQPATSWLTGGCNLERSLSRGCGRAFSRIRATGIRAKSAIFARCQDRCRPCTRPVPSRATCLLHFHVSRSSRIKPEGWPYATGFNDRLAGSTAVLTSKIKSPLIPFLISIQLRETERWKSNGAREVGRAHQAQPVVPACQRPSEVARRGPPGDCAVKVS